MLQNNEKAFFIAGYTSSWATSEIYRVMQTGQMLTKEYIQHVLKVGDNLAKEIMFSLGIEYPDEAMIKELHDFAKELNKKCKEYNIGA